MPKSRIGRAAVIVSSVTFTLAAATVIAAALSPLGQQMHRLANDLTQVQAAVAGTSISASATATTVAAIADMEDAATQARALIPPTAGTPALAAAYQNKIDELSDELKSLKNAVSSGDLATAQDLLARIKQTKAEGHQQFNSN